jgi:hypothetical protein
LGGYSEKDCQKVVLLPSGDQDDTYATYIKPHWPTIEYRQFKDVPNYGYGAQLNAKAEDASFLTAKWMNENVSSRGSLGALYRVWGDGKQMVKGDILDYFGFSGLTNEELKKKDMPFGCLYKKKVHGWAKAMTIPL